MHGDGSFLNGSAQVVSDVIRERIRQNEKHPETDGFPDGTGGFFFARQADEARAACDRAAAFGSCSWQLVLREETYEAFAETDPEKLREELVQVAAVAFRWVEAIDARMVD